MTPSCGRGRPPCDLGEIDDEDIAEIIGPTYAGVVPTEASLEVMSTKPLSAAQRAEIGDLVSCAVKVEVVKYSRVELEEFTDTAFEVNDRLAATRHFSVSLDYQSNTISAETPENPFPAELREAILQVVPGDAIKFAGGAEEQRVP